MGSKKSKPVESESEQDKVESESEAEPKLVESKSEKHSPLAATRARTRITNLQQLAPADHIAFWRKSLPLWHHAIFLEEDSEHKNILVIHYNNTATEFVQANSSVKATVRKEWITVNCAKDDIYRFDYKPDESLPPEEVIKRAEQKLHEDNYHLFKNNCEHFARWCKSGQAQSNQTEDLKGSAKIWSAEVALKIAKTASQDAIELALKQCLKQGGKAAFKASAEAVGAVGVIAIELVDLGKAVKKDWDLYKAGDLSKKEFVKTVANEFGKMSSSTLGAILGDIVGQIVIPIPFVGGMIGGFVGWLFGKLIAPWIGRLFAWLTDMLFVLFKNNGTNAPVQQQLTLS